MMEYYFPLQTKIEFLIGCGQVFPGYLNVSKIMILKSILFNEFSCVEDRQDLKFV